MERQKTPPTETEEDRDGQRNVKEREKQGQRNRDRDRETQKQRMQLNAEVKQGNPQAEARTWADSVPLCRTLPQPAHSPGEPGWGWSNPSGVCVLEGTSITRIPGLRRALSSTGWWGAGRGLASLEICAQEAPGRWEGP